MPNSVPCDAIIVLCTAPDESNAQRLAASLLHAKLAACVTLLPGAHSFYTWEGKLECQQEVQMVIKSNIAHQPDLLHHLKQEHPYQTPELLVLSVQDGDSDYLTWLNASLR